MVARTTRAQFAAAVVAGGGGGGGGGTDAEIVRDTIAAALVAGSNITITVNDPGNTITIDATSGGFNAEDARDTIADTLAAGLGIAIVANDPADTITISALARGAQGTVDFGTGDDYAEVTILATWVTSSHRIVPTVRGGTADHPISDEDAAIEELHPVVVAITVATSITIGVHAPNTTTGQYLVDIVGAP